MATTLVDWLNDGTLPQTKTSGNWTPANFNTGKFRQSFTFTNASTHSSWRPASLTYWGWLTCNDGNGSFLWLEWDPGTSKHRFLVVGVDGVTFLAAVEISWTAGMTGTSVVDQSSASAGASTLTLSGLSTGNGTSAGWTRENIASAANLYLGVWGAGGFSLPAGSVTFGDIDDANDAVTRSASGSNAVDAVLAGTRAISRAIAASAAVAATLAATAQINRSASASNTVDATLAATATGGAVTRSASSSSTVDATLAATRQVARAASGTSTPDAVLAATRAVARTASGSNTVGATLAATLAGTSFGIGVTSSAIATYGHSAATLTAPGGYLPAGGGGADMDGRVPTAVETQATGSAIYALAGRPTSVNAALTDTHSNSYAGVQSRTLAAPWTAWELVTEVALGAAGGPGHEVTTGSVVGDEATLIWTELTQCAHLNDSSQAFCSIGSTYVSAPVDLDAPGWVIVDWIGDSGTFGAEGFVWTVEAVGEGTTLGTWQVLDSRIKSHTDGWIQVKRWARYFATATTGITLTINSGTLVPDQGAYLFAAAFQETNVTTRDASSSSTVAATLAATRAIARSASASNAVAATLAAARTATSTAASSSTVDATLAATRAVARTAAATSAADATIAASIQIARSVAASNATDAAIAATRAIQRAASASAAVDGQLAATRQVERAAAASSTAAATLAATATAAGTRSASAESTVDATLSAARSVARGATVESAVDAVLAAARAVERTATATSAVDATLAATSSGTIVALPRTFTVTVGIPAADDFTVEVTE